MSPFPCTAARASRRATLVHLAVCATLLATALPGAAVPPASPWWGRGRPPWLAVNDAYDRLLIGKVVGDQIRSPVGMDDVVKDAALGWRRRQYLLGVAYRIGCGVERDPVQAFAWFGKAARAGDADAQLAFALAYLHGTGTAADPAAGLHWLQQAAAQGHAAARYRLAMLYRAGRVVPPDRARAAQLLAEAAEGGVAEAQLELARAHETGRGARPDARAAATWYRRAAETIVADTVDCGRWSCFGLQPGAGDPAVSGWRHGSLAESSERVEARRRWRLRKAAALGDPDALYLVAEGAEGRGPLGQESGRAPSAATARQFERAAALGQADAQYTLATRHHFGIGTAANLAKARRWYLKAARQGHARAMHELGALYEDGEGVPQDMAAAADWYLRAAQAGGQDSQLYVARMYAEGHGVGRDPVLAFAWFLVAARRPLSVDASMLGRLALSTRQRGEAHRLAREWTPGAPIRRLHY